MIDSDRIRFVLDYTKLNAAALSKELGLGNKTRIYNVLNGSNGISSQLAKIITDKYRNISYNWLLTGEGEMLLEQTAGDRELQPENRKAQESDLSRALSIIESQNQSLERLSEAALSFARSLEKLVESKVDPAQLSKAG